MQKLPRVEAELIDGDDGTGVKATVFVPTYDGGAIFTIYVERDADGDWRVYLPDTEGFDVFNGIVYLGAPDS